MLRFVADENFNGAVGGGLLRALPELDIVRVQDVGLANTDDPLILEWAAEQRRVVLTHDRRTMIAFAWQRVAGGLPMRGLVVAARGVPIRTIIEDIVLLAQVTDEEELNGRVIFLPL